MISQLMPSYYILNLKFIIPNVFLVISRGQYEKLKTENGLSISQKLEEVWHFEF